MYKDIVRLILILFLCCLFIESTYAQDISEEYPLMPLEILENSQDLPSYISPSLNNLGEANKSLNDFPKSLNYFEFLGKKWAERNQGNCGSCWIWAMTGAMEIAFNKAVYDGKIENADYVGNQKFSINYIDAKYLYKSMIEQGVTLEQLTSLPKSGICNGGYTEQFASLHSSSDSMIGGVSYSKLMEFGLACFDSVSNEYVHAAPNFGNDQESHICAASNGDLYCWGRGNSYGQLGSNATSDLMTPRKVNGATNVSALATGRGITCYVSDGELYCFGSLMTIGLDRITSVPQKITIGRVNVTLAEENSVCEVSYGRCNINGIYQKLQGIVACKPESYDLLYQDLNDDGVYDCLEAPPVSPTITPTETPTDVPTIEPTEKPTVNPTLEPTSTVTPTVRPTVEPTLEPTSTVTPTVKPTVEPTPEEFCPERIPVNIEANNKGKKKIIVLMDEINKECFDGNYVYQVKVVKKGNKNLYKSKKQKFVTPKLQSGQYKVSYRVMKKTTKKIKVRVNGRKVLKKKVALKPVTKWSNIVKVKIK